MVPMRQAAATEDDGYVTVYATGRQTGTATTDSQGGEPIIFGDVWVDPLARSGEISVAWRSPLN